MSFWIFDMRFFASFFSDSSTSHLSRRLWYSSSESWSEQQKFQAVSENSLLTSMHNFPMIFIISQHRWFISSFWKLTRMTFDLKGGRSIAHMSCRVTEVHNNLLHHDVTSAWINGQATKRAFGILTGTFCTHSMSTWNEDHRRQFRRYLEKYIYQINFIIKQHECILQEILRCLKNTYHQIWTLRTEVTFWSLGHIHSLGHDSINILISIVNLLVGALLAACVLNILNM